MAIKDESVRDFLTTRRAKITPDMAGLPPGSGVRRVPGLRREEVALLSGVSVDYYTKIERGDLSGVSDEVLDAVARTLRLTRDETAYLYDLARTARRPARSRRRPRPAEALTPQVQQLMDSMSATPVVAMNGRLDMIGANALGRAVFSIAVESPTRSSSLAPPNFASFVFLDPAAAEFYADLAEAAATCVQILRTQAGSTPHDKRLTGLIGELSTRSEDFRQMWAAHDVGRHRSGAKTLHHREVGDLELSFEQVRLDSAPSITLSAYLAEPASPTAERLQLLASWASAPTTPH